MEEVLKAKHYIAVNAGGRYPLSKIAQDYTEYFYEALSFSNLYEAYRYIEKHRLEKIATVITRMNKIPKQFLGIFQCVSETHQIFSYKIASYLYYARDAMCLQPFMPL